MTPLGGAGGLVALEGLALVVGGAVYAVRGLVGAPADRLGAVVGGVLAVVVGLGVGTAGRALLQARPWATSPSVVVQLMVVVVAVGLLQGGVVLVGAPLLACAVAVLAGLAAPSSRERLRRSTDPS